MGSETPAASERFQNSQTHKSDNNFTERTSKIHCKTTMVSASKLTQILALFSLLLNHSLAYSLSPTKAPTRAPTPTEDDDVLPQITDDSYGDGDDDSSKPNDGASNSNKETRVLVTLNNEAGEALLTDGIIEGRSSATLEEIESDVYTATFYTKSYIVELTSCLYEEDCEELLEQGRMDATVVIMSWSEVKDASDNTFGEEIGAAAVSVGNATYATENASKLFVFFDDTNTMPDETIESAEDNVKEFFSDPAISNLLAENIFIVQGSTDRGEVQDLITAINDNFA